MWQTFSVHIKGTAPLIMHNGQLADPLNPYAKRLKELTDKKKKTDSDYEDIAAVEWLGGLYLDDEQRPIIPGENIESGMTKAAGKIKLAQVVKAAVISDGNWPLIFDGPKSLDQLKSDARFRDTRGVRNPGSGSRIMRTRPIFRVWELKFDLQFETEDLNPGQITQILEILSRRVGLSDYRPKFGRFKIVSAKLVA